MISPDDIKTEPDESTNEENIQSFSNLSALLKDENHELSITQGITQQSIDNTATITRPSIKEWLVNGLVHCPKCKKTKQIPYAFRRPTICQICRVNYVNQCSICKKKFTKFKTLRLHLQSKCGGKQLPKEFTSTPNESNFLNTEIKQETEIDIAEHNLTNLKNESFQQLKVNIKEEKDTDQLNNCSNVKKVHTPVEPSVGQYACYKCNQSFKNKYRKNIHVKYCNQLKCERCDFEGAQSAEELREHMKKEHTKVDPNDYWLCFKCNKPFTDKYVKNKHQKYCGLELTLKCQHCYYTTSRLERFQAHIQSHVSFIPQF